MRFLVAFLLLCLLASCSEEPPSGPPVVTLPRPGEAVVYSKHIEPIIKTSCGGTECHLNGEKEGGCALDTWEQVMAGSTVDGAMVIPFSSRLSHLFQHINTDSTLSPLETPRMPLSLDPLPMEQILAIKRWIDEGAKKDDGTIALAGAERQRLFVAVRSEGLVAVVDRSTNLIARFLDPGAKASGGGTISIVASPDGRYIYTAVPGTGVVARFDSRTLGPAGSANVGGSPGQVVLSSDGSTLYVGNFSDESTDTWITCVDANTMAVRRRIENVGRAPYGIALVPGGKYLAVANTLGDEIALVDVVSCEVVRRMDVSRGNPLIPGFFARYRPFGVTALADGHTLLVTCRRNGELRTFDIDEGVVTDSLFIGQQPGVPVMAPGGREIWVPDPSVGTITIIDAGTRGVIATIRDIQGGPNSVTFAPDGRRAYVICERSSGTGSHGSGASPGAVQVVDVPSRVVLRSIELPAGAEGAAAVR